MFSGKWKFCTAVIIGPRHVLTAAHCFYGFADKNNPLPCKGATPFKFGFHIDVIHGGVCAQEGDSCKEEDVKRVRIRKVVLPLDFVGHDCMCGNDLAIVEVETPIEFDGLSQPMCLVDFAMHLDKSTITHLTKQLGAVYDVGWGKFNGEQSQRLRHFKSKISGPSLKDDDHTIRSEPTFSEPQVTERPGYCQGDSGGPLMGDYHGRMVLIGIHSYGDDCQSGSNHFIRNTFAAAYTGVICRWTGICTSYRVDGDT
ncbi:Trypsin family protein [Aphelenchoides avenae]|nr:Trypsin family protein [Aphelenchus avenae]